MLFEFLCLAGNIAGFAAEQGMAMQRYWAPESVWETLKTDREERSVPNTRDESFVALFAINISFIILVIPLSLLIFSTLNRSSMLYNSRLFAQIALLDRQWSWPPRFVRPVSLKGPKQTMVGVTGRHP